MVDSLILKNKIKPIFSHKMVLIKMTNAPKTSFASVQSHNKLAAFKKGIKFVGSQLLKNLEFINKQNCCDFIQFIYILIFSGKINKKRNESIFLYLIQKGYERLQ